MTDPILHNRTAWDREAALGNPATIPIDDATLEEATGAILTLSLTGHRPLPPDWMTGIRGSRVLGLALGGGQQVPLLAAAGAHVTSFDNSPAQLAADMRVAERHGLSVDSVLGNMQAMDSLADAMFDVVFLGLGLQFVHDPVPVWSELARVLKPAGRLIGAFVNPVHYAFAWPDYDQGILRVEHALQYSDLTSLTQEQRQERFGADDPLEFGHTMEQILGGLTLAGFAVTGFMEDSVPGDPMAPFIANYFVVRATLSK